MKRATHFTMKKGWKIILSDMGINAAHVVALAGLPGDLLSREDSALSVSDYFKFWQALEDIAGVEELPLKVGRAISVEAFDPAIFACLCSPDLNTALRRLAHYKRLIGPMIFHVEVGQKKTGATIECYGYEGKIPRSLGAMELVFLTQLARLATRKKVVPLKLELPQVPKNLEPYNDYFERRIVRGEQVRIVFSAKDASRRFLTEDAGMWDFFEADLKRKLSDLETGTPAAQRVKSALLEMLPSGQSSIDKVASCLSMSTRSLQRHLQKESSSFQEVLNETRKELAQHYLGQSVISPGEISYLLGYQDSNSFIRAFKSWTGVTPSAYRQPDANGSSYQH